MNQYEQAVANMLAGGDDYPDQQWLLSPFDSWHENPYYQGEPQPHPEEDYPDEEDITRAIQSQ